MTQEQWLVYLWSIYPDGGYTAFYATMLIISFILLLLLALEHEDYGSEHKDSNWHYTKSPWYRLGKWKLIIPTVLLGLIFISNLIPDKKGFMYLIATPYIVDSGKSIIESLNDENSKLFKLNKIMDKALDTALTKISDTETNKP